MRFHRASFLAMAFLLVASCLLPANAYAKKMTLGTALRYAGTAPLRIGPNAVQLTVSGCKRLDSLAFTCFVAVSYPAPPPISTPTGHARVSAPVLNCKVRVSYRTRHSKTPQAKLVAPCHVTG